MVTEYKWGKCKACQSPNKELIDKSLQSHVPMSEISRRLAVLGDNLSVQNISNHRNHTKVTDPLEEERADTVAQLKEDMGKVPATMRAPYFAMIQWLEQSEHESIKTDTAIRAAESIVKMTGMKAKEALLFAFLEHKFKDLPGSTEPVRAELERLPLEDVAEVLETTVPEKVLETTVSKGVVDD